MEALFDHCYIVLPPGTFLKTITSRCLSVGRFRWRSDGDFVSANFLIQRRSGGTKIGDKVMRLWSAGVDAFLLPTRIRVLLHLPRCLNFVVKGCCFT